MGLVSPTTKRTQCTPVPVVSAITTIDTRGDLTIIVSVEENSPCREFVVCSRTLARASRYFSTLLYGPFEEAQRRFSPNWRVRLLGDDPDTFKLLLDLTHANIGDFPHDLNDRAMLNTILLADKYLLTDHLRIHARRWSEPHVKARNRRARELFDVVDNHGLGPLEIHEGVELGRWPFNPGEVQEGMHFWWSIGAYKLVWLGLLFYAWHCDLDDDMLIFKYPREPNPDRELRIWSAGRNDAESADYYTNTLEDELAFLPDFYYGMLAPSALPSFSVHSPFSCLLKLHVFLLSNLQLIIHHRSHWELTRPHGF